MEPRYHPTRKDQPDRQHVEHQDKQNTPKVSQQGSSYRWESDLILIYVQVDALLEARISMVAARRHLTDGGNRSSCPRAHPPHY